MLIIPPAKRKSRRVANRDAGATPTPPPAALTLVAATFDELNGYLYLQFDRPIDIAGVQTWAYTILDANTATTLSGYGSPEAEGDSGVRVTFTGTGPYDGAGVLLT